MVLYEMLTLHIPYESMAGQQANQANEQGKRPPLCRADFPCPVLARELMVWCWQQKPENRPDAPTIMEVASTEQFPRLLDGIRICNYGKVGGCGLETCASPALLFCLTSYFILVQQAHGHYSCNTQVLTTC